MVILYSVILTNVVAPFNYLNLPVILFPIMMEITLQ